MTTTWIKVSLVEAPRSLMHAVLYLNQLLRVDRAGLSKLIDAAVDINEQEAEKIEETGCITRYLEGRFELTPLGIIAGLVNEEPHRLCANFDDDNVISEFFVVKVIRTQPLAVHALPSERTG